jgi:alkylation response protein AidB-like acyl-CoA dehydrogenase
MYNLHLSAEQLEIRDTVRDFVAQEIKPFAEKPERMEALDRSLPPDILERASQMGLRALALSEDAGGAGADGLTACIVAEELAFGDPDLAATLVETSLLARLFEQWMTPAQRERFLTAFLEDDRYHLALADHEPDSDTQLGVNYHRPDHGPAPVRTTAVRSGNQWVVNGTKDCTANAPLARLFAVTVQTDPAGAPDGVRTLLVPRDTPGLTVRAYGTTGARQHGACGEVAFADCRVDADQVLNANTSVYQAHRATLLAAINLGIGRAAHEAAIVYAQLRVQGGRRIVEHQAIATKLADIAITLQVARGAVWQAAWAIDHPDAQADRSVPDLPLHTIARAFTAESVYRAAKDAAECFGAMGVMRDMPLQKFIHDARICLHVGEGVSDAKLNLAEALVGYRRFPAAAARAAE